MRRDGWRIAALPFAILDFLGRGETMSVCSGRHGMYWRVACVYMYVLYLLPSRPVPFVYDLGFRHFSVCLYSIISCNGSVFCLAGVFFLFSEVFVYVGRR